MRLTRFMMEILETNRLILEPLSLSHGTEKYLAWLNDPEVYKYLETRGNQNKDTLRNFIEKQIRGEIAIWAIIIKESGLHIGNIKIDPINWKHGFGEYGILMGDKEQWGKGYAKEASQAVIDYFFEEKKLRKINLGVVKDNISAVKLYEKMEFKTEGLYKSHFTYDGVYHDILRMALFNPKFKMKSKLILGTVQFGLKYGVNNESGLPSEELVNAILSAATGFGIKKLDTAAAYGVAEERIGNFHDDTAYRFDIISKFSKDENVNWNESLENSLSLLKVDKVDTILFHSFESYWNHKSELSNIVSAGKGTLFNKLGVSVYTNDEMESLLTDDLVALVQLPFNLLDNHSKRASIIQKLKAKGKEIHTRSCFLQGLFFLDEGKIPEKIAALKPFLKEIKQMALEHKIEMGHLALQYALSKDYIDQVLIGVETLEQLETNIRWAENKIDDKILCQIDSINVEHIEMLNP